MFCIIVLAAGGAGGAPALCGVSDPASPPAEFLGNPQNEDVAGKRGYEERLFGLPSTLALADIVKRWCLGGS